MSIFGDVLGPDFANMMAEAHAEGKRQARRVVAGIPKDAAGPWDAALALAAQARVVTEQHRALT